MRRAIAARSVSGNVGMVPSRRARRRDARGISRGDRQTLFRMSEYGRGACERAPFRHYARLPNESRSTKMPSTSSRSSMYLGGRGAPFELRP